MPIFIYSIPDIPFSKTLISQPLQKDLNAPRVHVMTGDPHPQPHPVVLVEGFPPNWFRRGPTLTAAAAFLV